MKKIRLFLSIIMFCPLFIFGQVIRDTIIYNANQVNYETVDSFTVVSISGCGFNSQPGAPQLPLVTHTYLVPIDKKVTGFTIARRDTIMLNGRYRVFPYQGVESIDGIISPFIFPDTLIYNSDNIFPSQNISIESSFYSLDYQLVTISFSPIQYIPITKTLILLF